MDFEIDVSGEDLLSKNYTICIANKEGSIIKGFKFNEELISILSARFGQGVYKNYQKSHKGKALFKVRLYCIVIYYLIKSIKFKGDLSLTICRDFFGREIDIKENLNYFLSFNLGMKPRIYFNRLNPESNAHKYAYLMRMDSKNKMDTYENLNLEDIEKWLRKQ